MGEMEFDAEVKEIIKRTYNVKSFRFEKPRNLSYKPGQFMFITVKIDCQERQKHFTISSSPTEDFLEFTKKLTGHEFSNALDALKEGVWVRIRAPYGFFSFEGEHDKVGMLTGGIGVTPLRSMCKYVTDSKLSTRITLLYSNRTGQDIVFKDQFDEMQKQNRNLKVVYTLTRPSEEWEGYTGRVNKGMVEKEISDYTDRVFYTSGPPKLVESMEIILRELEVPEDQINKENFPGY